MEYNVLMEMHKKIDECASKGIFKNRFVVIFGSNEPAERIMEYLTEKGITVNGLIDNNSKKNGMVINGVTVSLPEKLLQQKKENALILIASKYYPEMVVQLAGMGYNEKEHIRKLIDYISHRVATLTEEEFHSCVDKVKRGKKVYENLKDSRGDVEKIFVFPLIALGDAYVGMSCLHDYIKKNNIKSYALVLANKACSKIAWLFGFDDNLFRVERSELSDFIQYGVFTDMADGKMLVVNHKHPYTSKIGEIGNYREVNFMDHYRYTILGLAEGARPELPSAIRDSEASLKYVSELFENEKLERGKTVILFPYAKTATKMPETFWEKLALLLVQKGYTVCTNSGGDGEPAVKGTKPLFFDIRYALETVEAAGTVIGLRSGLCDVIASAKAKKIILYPDRFYGPDSFLNFFSLNRMELCDDAEELLCDKSEEDMIREVLDRVG